MSNQLISRDSLNEMPLDQQTAYVKQERVGKKVQKGYPIYVLPMC